MGFLEMGLGLAGGVVTSFFIGVICSMVTWLIISMFADVEALEDDLNTYLIYTASAGAFGFVATFMIWVIVYT